MTVVDGVFLICLIGASEGAFQLFVTGAVVLLSATMDEFLFSMTEGAYLLSVIEGAYLLSVTEGAYLLSVNEVAFLLSKGVGQLWVAEGPIQISVTKGAFLVSEAEVMLLSDWCAGAAVGAVGMEMEMPWLLAAFWNQSVSPPGTGDKNNTS